MSISAKIRRAPTRIATGAYILNTGLGKLRSGDEAAKHMHGTASGAYPALERVEPKTFMRALGVAEVGLGAALLLPIVPAAAAGIGLATFSGALLGMYWRTPGMHQPNNPLPTQDGLPFAKDIWLAGIGTSLVIDSLFSPAHDARLHVAHEMHEKRAVATQRARLVRHRARTAGRRVREAVPSVR